VGVPLSRAQAARATADQAERAVAAALEAVGYTVININDLAGNFPLADLGARKAGYSVLVQVRGTTTRDGKFAAPPEKARSLTDLSSLLGCTALYAFVHLLPDGPLIRFADASHVAQLAEEDEANYQGTNRYHVNMTQFDVTADYLDTLLPD
jgi:hypothetical protein